MHVLLIEDRAGDARLVAEALAECAPQLALHWSCDLGDGLAQLAQAPVDVVLLDLSLPDSEGLATFRAVQAAAPRRPIVILSGCGDDELALAAVQEGAQDFLPKCDLSGSLLSRVLHYAIERKRAAEQILTLNIELETRVRERTRDLIEANRELEAFAYTVAHDLRRPLRAMDGFSDLLIKDAADRLSAPQRDYLERIRRACDQMSRLIDALLELTRLPYVPLRQVPLDLGALGQEILDELARRTPDRHVERRLAENLATIGDAALVRIVLENLLSNAWKFTRCRQCARIMVGSYYDLGEEVFFVRDNGAGFDMTYADKLFAPFERLHRESDFEGLGVGLATVQRVVKRHGGRVWAEGAVDEGATFYFTLAPPPQTPTGGAAGLPPATEIAPHGYLAQNHPAG
ncbi:MAG: response regulator [Pirellulales bacterium]|nr:response regulator [Pirellulales bacterium]